MTIATFPHIGAHNNVLLKMPDKSILRKAGMVSFMFASTLSSMANVTPIIDPMDVIKQVNVTTGVLTKKINEPSKNENEINRVVFGVFNPSSNEYDNSNHVSNVLFNGSLLEVKPMNNKPYDYSKVEEVTEANLKVSPYSVFELDEEEIDFTSDLKYDYSKVLLIDNDYHKKANPIDDFTL